MKKNAGERKKKEKKAKGKQKYKKIAERG